MNEYSSLRHRRRGVLLPVVALALCVILSASVLFSRLVGYSAYQVQQYIPLTVSNGLTQVTTMQRQTTAAQRHILTKLSDTAGEMVTPVAETQPTETDTVWLTMTDLELFRVSYENGEGNVTVRSAGEDKVIAPGTSNSFVFSLENTSDVGLDYDIEIEAYFTIEGGNEKVPVQLRLSDYNGNYLIGSPDEFEALADLNVATGSGSLSAGYIAPYTIEWQWPFEGDDAYDTELGNFFLETETEVSFVMEVRTFAEQGGEGGLPSTGDRGITFAVVSMCLSAGGLLILVIPWKRKREEEDVR